MKNRNESIDIIRGLAIILVVLGHTILLGQVNGEESLIFQIIWSLQMPLFFLISGYVTRYSKSIETRRNLWNFTKKRTISYMLPYLVWTLLIKQVVLPTHNGISLTKLPWMMDNGYWFLWVLWLITITYGLSSFAANKLNRNHKRLQKPLVLLGCVIGMLIMIVVAYLQGSSFLGAKYYLYYIIFYILGYLWGQYQDIIFGKPWGKSIVDGFVVFSAFVWMYLILRYNFHRVEDTPIYILLRCIASVCGSSVVIYSIVYMLSKLQYFSRGGILSLAGKFSLEIYLIHFSCLNLLKTDVIYSIFDIHGAVIVLCNFILTISLTTAFIILFSNIPILNYILFGKNLK